MTDELSKYADIRSKRLEIATAQQRSAAKSDYSVWVEASAGTGKTKVLTDRVIRLLLSGVEPQRLLCLTYTKAAAVQMNERIADYLGKWAVISDDKLKENIRDLLGKNNIASADINKLMPVARILFAKLLDTPGGIKIQTIHSFCQDILKRFPLEAGVSPYFSVLDDRERIEIMAKIKDNIISLQKNLNSNVLQALQYFIDNTNEYSFSDVMQNIIDNRLFIAEILRKHGNFTTFLTALSKKLGVKESDSDEIIKQNFMQTINISELNANIAAWQKGKIKDNEKVEKLQQILANNFSASDYDLYKTIFLTGDNKPFSESNMAAKSAQEADTNLLERAYKEAFRLVAAQNKLISLKLYQSTKYFLTIAQYLNSEYDNFKKSNAKLDYDDLIILTRNLLASPSAAAWVLYKLDGGIDHILLDEAQDTSPEQWDIIKYLSEEFFAGQGASDKQRTVFAVGDRKQSIFSFQGADPDKFDEMSVYFQNKAQDRFKKVNLEVSFRSAPAILQSVNKVFANQDVYKGVVAYDETINHLPFRAGEFSRVEIWPPYVAKSDDKVQDESALQPPIEMKRRESVRTKLAYAIAEKIKSLVNETSLSEKPLNYRDFMVLVRKRDAFVEEFIRACKQLHVEISGADKMVLTEQIAVQDLISLGKFLLLPNDDLALAEILKSPLFNLDDNDLFDLCYNRKNSLLWSRLGDNKKYEHIYKQLQFLLDKTDYIRPYELYNTVLSDLNGREKYISRMGIEVEDALDEFLSLTIAFEQQNVPSLQNFINWISRSELTVKRAVEQKDINAVRLMTVHASKGLQAPIVFLPDTISMKSKTKQSLLSDNELMYYPLNKTYCENKCAEIKNSMKQKEDDEYRRLLYVALTRAEDRLFICGYSNSAKINAHSWYSLCRDNLVDSGFPADEIYINETPEFIAKKASDEQFLTYNVLPAEDWLFTNVKPENPLAKPYTPSKPIDEEVDAVSPLEESGNFYKRGIIIHKLLQFLPQNMGDMEKSIDVFLQKNAADFSAVQQNKIKSEVVSLLKNPQFAEFFGPKAKSEVAISGEVDGKIVSAQLDKLLILPDKIIIVDFKTNRPPAQNLMFTPKVYIDQLTTYAKLLKKIYPNHVIETYILWTNEARLMQVS